MNGPIVKKLSDAKLKVLRGGCGGKRRHSRKHSHRSKHHCHRRPSRIDSLDDVPFGFCGFIPGLGEVCKQG